MAFKMSPIGRNKDPYESMARRGYIAPTEQKKGVGYTKQGIKIDDPKEGQSTVDKAAEENIIWNEPGDWEDANDGTGREKRTTTGQGKAEGYYEEENEITEFMGNEKWKEFLKSPKGQEYLAARERSKTEYRDKPGDSSNEIDSEIPRAQTAEDMKDYQLYTGAHSQELVPYQKMIGMDSKGEPIYETAYKYQKSGDGMVDAQYRDVLNKDEIKEKSDSEDENITIHTLTPDFDRLSKDDQKTIQDKIIQENVDKGDLSAPYTLAEKEYNEENSPNPQLSATRQLMNKYMPNKSIVKQTNDDWWDGDPNKSTDLNEFELNFKSNNEDSELIEDPNVEITGDTTASYINDDGEKIPLNRRVTMAFQNRGHSIATQCAKSEGGSGCVKKVGSGWKVISNKTGKYWPANYDSEASANAALKAYHAG